MIEVLGTRYITDKEASSRYGYSRSWFQHRRHTKLAPRFIRLEGKILYDISETDRWFKEKLQYQE